MGNLNWKTTVLGIVVALLTAGPDLAKLFTNETPPSIRVVALAVATILLGYFAKDKNITGKH